MSSTARGKQQYSRRGKTRGSTTAESSGLDIEKRKLRTNCNNIQFVHLSGDTHFEPSKLADLKLPPTAEKDGFDTVVRLEIIDIANDEVYEKLRLLGPRLHSLSIRDMSLTTLPKELQPIWENLTSLDLSGNSFVEASLSDVLPYLGSLSELNLNDNLLQLLPKSFKNLSSIKRLFINRNKLVSLNNIGAVQLRWMVANGNQLPSIESFLTSSRCDRTLQVLDISKNELLILPPSIRTYRNLVDLDISNNKLRVLPLEVFKIPSLQFLNAACNRLSHVPSFSTQTTSFSKSQLRSVDLSDNVLSKLPEHLLWLADNVDVANNSIKFIRGNVLRKIPSTSKKQLRIEGNPLLFPPANLVANDGYQGLLNFFSRIKNKIKRRQGIKMFIVGCLESGKTSFIKSLIDEFPHIAEEPTLIANFDEVFVDIDAPGEFLSLPTPTLETTKSPVPALLSPADVNDTSCCGNDHRRAIEAQVEVEDDEVGNQRTIGLPRELTAVRKKVKKKALVEEAEADMLGKVDSAALWKCVQLPVIDISSRGIFAALRKYFLEDSSIYMIVFDLSSFPTATPESLQAIQWYNDNIGAQLEEIFTTCNEAYVILIGSFVDKTASAAESAVKCDAVLSMARSHCKRRIDLFQEEQGIIERKQQISMADQERLTAIKFLLDKQKIKVVDHVVTFSSKIEGNYVSTTLATLMELIQAGAAQNKTYDPFFRPALEPVTNLHADIIEYLEAMATSMKFPIIYSKTFEEIFSKEYQIISEQIVKRIPKFLHLISQIFMNTKNEVLSDLVVLRPEFISEFLQGLFAFVIDEKPFQSALPQLQDLGRRLLQLGSQEVRDLAMRFVRTGILNASIGELLVRKHFNIRANETLGAAIADGIANHRSSGSVSEVGDASLPVLNEEGGKVNDRICSAPIHVCVEKFSVGFHLAYNFDLDSLEYATMFHSKISEIDMKSSVIRAKYEQTQRKSSTVSTSATGTTSEKTSKPSEKSAAPANKMQRKVSFINDSIKPSSSKTSAGNTAASSSTVAATRGKGDEKSVTNNNTQEASDTEEENIESSFFLKIPKTVRVNRENLSSAVSSVLSDGRLSKSQSASGTYLGAVTPSAGTNSGLVPRYMLFPGLRPPVLPQAYRLAISDAWDTLSSEMWIGASISFPKNVYPSGVFHEIITRVRRMVPFLEFAYVWQTGAFGKFVNSATCFVKMHHQHCEPLDCDLTSLGSMKTDKAQQPFNTIIFELRTSSDVPSAESASMSNYASFLFSEKTLRDYIMNLWERLHEILTVVEEYFTSNFAILLLERRVRCPCCGSLCFTGEWTAPRELQAFPEKVCPNCTESVDTAYLVQPKSSQRELCERIVKDIQKHRLSQLLENSHRHPGPKQPQEEFDEDNSSSENNSHPNKLKSSAGSQDIDDDEDDDDNDRTAVRSAKQLEKKKSMRSIADRDELLAMMA